MWRLIVEDSFSAAHRIPGHGGKCAGLHGHNYAFRVALSSAQLDALGFVVDIDLVRTLLTQLVTDKFDHKNLNDVPPFTAVIPSLENVAKHIYDELRGALAQLNKNLSLLWVEVAESQTAVIRYQPK